MAAVRVPFHLLRRDRPEACAALLLVSDDLRELLNLCGRVGTDPLPPIFPVVDGFLVAPERIPDSLPARTIRLRRLAENLFVPVDADLVPALHPDEAADLTRQRGLIFLPPNRCLGFDSNRPLDAVSILKVPDIRRDKWQPFPDGEPLADRLTTIARAISEGPPLAILEAGGEGIGTEQPRPPAVNPVKTAVGKIGMGIGKGLAAMGSALGIGALGRLGQKLMGAAMAAVPRLSEALLGKQEAALRELLRKFREGKTDEALRNALPMGGQNSGYGGAHTSDQLPTHDIRYSLGGLVGSGGPASAWIGGQDVQQELMNEYRKAAQAALAQGDHRRAAFIYGRLLGELHTAADILAQGGMHHDAAVLYRDLLNWPHWAAREFEAAGEGDEALRLYRQVGDHEEAGDLLRRMGEEEQAIEEYHRAAHKLGEERADYLRAGELMLKKTSRSDLAGAYFTLGWQKRDANQNHLNNAIPCAARLAEILAFAEPIEPFYELIDKVHAWLTPPGNVARTADFFNAIAKLAELPHLVKHREELRDRSRLALAGKLRDHPRFETRPGNAISDLFGNSGLWSAAVVSDASYALKAALKSDSGREPEERPYRSLQLGTGTVTAVAFATLAELIIVGFNDGRIVAYHPRNERTMVVAVSQGREVAALSVDPEGTKVVSVAMGSDEDDLLLLRSFMQVETGRWQQRAERQQRIGQNGWFQLNPTIFGTPGVGSVFLSTHDWFVQYRGDLLVLRSDDADSTKKDRLIYLSLPVGNKADAWFKLGDRFVQWPGGVEQPIGWKPDSPLETSLMQPPITWLQTNDRIELAGFSMEGVITWTETGGAEPRSKTFQVPEGYRAATIWKPGVLIAVTASNRIDWLHAKYAQWATPVKLPFPAKAVACFPSHSSGEVVIILEDGEAVRVSVPA